MAISDAVKELAEQLPYADRTQTELIERKLEVLSQMQQLDN